MFERSNLLWSLFWSLIIDFLLRIWLRSLWSLSWSIAFKKNLISDHKIAIFLFNYDIKTNLLSIFSLINKSISILSFLVINTFYFLSFEILRTNVFIDELEDIWFWWLGWNWSFFGRGPHSELFLCLCDLIISLNFHNFEFIGLSVDHCHECFWFPIEEISYFNLCDFLSECNWISFDWNMLDNISIDRVNVRIIEEILLASLDFEA